MSEGSQVSKVTICVEILKWHWPSHWLTKVRYRAARAAKNNNGNCDCEQTKLPVLLSGWCDNWTWGNQQSKSHHTRNHDLVIFLIFKLYDVLMMFSSPIISLCPMSILYHMVSQIIFMIVAIDIIHLRLFVQTAAHLLTASAASMKSRVAKLQ